MKKIIGISGNILIDEGGMFPGYKRSYVNDDYVKSVIAAGGIPLILPLNTNEEIIKAQLEMIDGLILSGGYDVNPLLFGEEPHKLLGMTMNDRDTFDAILIKHALDMHLPILGVCRGCQMLAAAGGGTLYQDCSLSAGSYIKHSQGHTPSQPSHTVTITKDSALYSIFGAETLVNSFHHMSVKDVPKGFKVTAVAKDGIIEAIEKIAGSFALATQWHPEMMAGSNDDMLKLFKLLIAKCENKEISS
jgi:putative glutamine amidotransferase